MVYTRKHPALLIMGLVLLAIGWLAGSGNLKDLTAYLGTARLLGEMTTLPYVFGTVALVVGLWHQFGSHKPGQLDYYLSTVAGGTFILLIAMIVRWFLDPWVAVMSKAMGPVLADKFLHDVLGLNYIVLGIATGMIVVNVFKIPDWAENGVRLSRLGLKTGVVLLGTLYSLAELWQIGLLSVVMIGFFVLGSVWLVLIMGERRKIPNSMGGVLSAGVGVCGVSAAVAAAPVVQAKSTEIAYTIGTILVWGLGCMFLFPAIGHLFGMGHIQFGAWAGTGILNSAQVAGAALAFQPNGIETLKVAEIFNITRVLFLPIIVLWLAVWYVKREESEGKTSAQVSVGKVVFEKFPVFVLGFILLFALSSTGVFAPAQHYQGAYFDNKIKEDKLLSAKDLGTLAAEAGKIQRADQKAALERLVANKKLMSVEDDDTLRGVVNAKILSKDASAVLTKAHRAVRHTSKKIAMFRDFIIWLFAFGLTGLGMQITIAAIKQAGGQPLVIGGVVGTAKAVLSLIVVLLFVREAI
ncbi:MAG: putative sulfate exporter family transporter [Rhodospirillales bacterium]|nr:putative sulfate exporter family transporter [Rhodospirillales bacterium]